MAFQYQDLMITVFPETNSPGKPKKEPVSVGEEEDCDPDPCGWLSNEPQPCPADSACGQCTHGCSCTKTHKNAEFEDEENSESVGSDVDTNYTLLQQQIDALMAQKSSTSDNF